LGHPIKTWSKRNPRGVFLVGLDLSAAPPFLLRPREGTLPAADFAFPGALRVRNALVVPLAALTLAPFLRAMLFSISGYM